MKIGSCFAALVLVACGAAATDDATPRQQAQTAAVADPRPANAPDQTPAFPGQTDAPLSASGVAFDVVTVASGLERPWAIAFLPSGRLLVTERPGRLRLVAADGTLSPPATGLPAMDTRGQGGLLDVALDPAFGSNRLIYWSFGEPHDDGSTNTAVARGTLVDDPAAPRVEGAEIIYRQRPPMNSRAHYGSRLVFGNDGTLFITHGDRLTNEGRGRAQALDSTVGKIARINADGSIPKDNPFAGKDGALPEIWSLGHRNVQAAAIHPATGELWEVEHGTRGGDEINVVAGGKDYGWPTIAYGIEYRGGPITGGITAKAGMEQPIYYWDPVIAPSGMLFYTGDLFPSWKGSLFVGGLESKRLVRLDLKGNRVVGEERLLGDLQPEGERIRDVRQGPDGAIYLATDNPQGRILKLVPKR